MRVLAGAVALFLLAATPAGAQIAQLEISVGTDQVRNVPFPVTVTARDAGGAIVADSSTVIDFTGTLPDFDPPQFDQGDGTWFFQEQATLANGVATISARSRQTGSVRFRVNAGTIQSTSPFIGVATDGPHLEMDPISTTQYRNVPFDVTVRLIDRFGNPVDSDTQQVEFTGGSVAQFDPTSTGAWECCPQPKTMTDGVVTMPLCGTVQDDGEGATLGSWGAATPQSPEPRALSPELTSTSRTPPAEAPGSPPRSSRTGRS